MLSDEENEAIEWLKRLVKINKRDNLDNTFAEILLNLIEKQQKEIEELKEKNRQGKMRIVQLENEITARIEDVNKYFTPNDKIKAKIEEIDKVLNEDIYAIDGHYDDRYYRYLQDKHILQSLLEKE